MKGIAWSKVLVMKVSQVLEVEGTAHVFSTLAGLWPERLIPQVQPSWDLDPKTTQTAAQNHPPWTVILHTFDRAACSCLKSFLLLTAPGFCIVSILVDLEGSFQQPSQTVPHIRELETQTRARMESGMRRASALQHARWMSLEFASAL